MSILEVKNVSKSFGGVKANVDISMSVKEGSIVGLIGPNGSGKTTLFNSIVGTHPIDNGSIKFNEKEVSHLPIPVVDEKNSFIGVATQPDLLKVVASDSQETGSLSWAVFYRPSNPKS